MTKPRKAAVASAAVADLLIGLYPAPRSASARTRSGVSRKIGWPRGQRLIGSAYGYQFPATGA